MSTALLNLVFETLDLVLTFIENQPQITATVQRRMNLLKTLSDENRDPTADELNQLRTDNQTLHNALQARAAHASGVTNVAVIPDVPQVAASGHAT